MAKLAACSPSRPFPIKWTIKCFFQLDVGVCSFPQVCALRLQWKAWFCTPEQHLQALKCLETAQQFSYLNISDKCFKGKTWPIYTHNILSSGQMKKKLKLKNVNFPSTGNPVFSKEKLLLIFSQHAKLPCTKAMLCEALFIHNVKHRPRSILGTLCKNTAYLPCHEKWYHEIPMPRNSVMGLKNTRLMHSVTI